MPNDLVIPDVSSAPKAAVVMIRPTNWGLAASLRDLWEYRELLYFLVWRDIKLRYKQTALGAAWAILQPFLSMVVFSILFGRLARIPSDGLPYPVFAYAALLPWQFFAHALTESSNSLVSNQALITKVYFPRLAIPMATVLAGVMDFAVAFVILLALMFYYGIAPTMAALTLPLFLLLAILTALAVSLWLSVLNVKYRDVRYTVPFLTQFWMFASPVVYPSTLIPGQWRLLYGLNPMVGVIDGFRWALLGKGEGPGWMLVVSVLAVLLLLVGGLFYFASAERTFADQI